MSDAEADPLASAAAAEEKQLSVLLEHARREMRAMEARIAQLERQVELLETENAGHHAHLLSLQRENGQLAERDASTGIYLEEAREQIIRLRQQLTQADTDRRAAQKLEEAQRAELMQLKTENRLLSAASEDQIRRIRALDQIIDGYVSSNARIRTDFQRLREQLKR